MYLIKKECPKPDDSLVIISYACVGLIAQSLHPASPAIFVLAEVSSEFSADSDPSAVDVTGSAVHSFRCSQSDEYADQPVLDQSQATPVILKLFEQPK